MPNINIDGQEYDLDKLPGKVKEQLQSLQFVEAELARLQSQAAVYQTARIAYINAVKMGLAEMKLSTPLPVSDTLKLG